MKDYKREALRAWHYRNHLNPIDQSNNVALGIVGESGELADELKKQQILYEYDFEALREEAGDCIFYLQIAAHIVEQDIPSFANPAPPPGHIVSIERLTGLIIRLCGEAHALSYWLYCSASVGWPVSGLEKQSAPIQQYADALHLVAVALGCNLEDLKELNYAKLRRKFPGAYGEGAACAE